jgi:hypothetical protein
LFSYFHNNNGVKLEGEASESGKKDHVNFKRVIWHESFIQLLDTLHAISKTGLYIKCGDGIIRHFYPVILILSADYEEQYEFSTLFL